MLELTIYVFKVTVAAIVVQDVLMQPGMILDWYYRLIDRLPREWMRKPLGECIYCFVGQVMLWAYVTHYWGDLRLTWAAFSVLLAIFLTKIYNRVIYGNDNQAN